MFHWYESILVPLEGIVLACEGIEAQGFEIVNLFNSGLMGQPREILSPNQRPTPLIAVVCRTEKKDNIRQRLIAPGEQVN